jgi:16S rRNA (adenine1518-N6/adenine1519-N6)-dimethyltransferase
VTLTRRQVRDLLAEHGAQPRQARGQNFVVDPNTVRRVARLAGVGPGDRVVEVGAGLGSLTLALAETGAAVTAVEVDTRLLAALRSVVADVAVQVVEGDAMRLDWSSLLGDGGDWTLVANLPYNIATPLLADLLDGVPAITRMVVMVQREVAERLAARAGDDAYGAVSVKVAYWSDAAVVGQVPPSVFWPQPKVESSIVDIRRHDRQPAGVDRRRLFELVAAGFGQRRKMLRRALAGLVSADQFEAAGVRPDARAEELDLDGWARLAACSPSSPPQPS